MVLSVNSYDPPLVSDLSFWLRSPGDAGHWWSCSLRRYWRCLQNRSCSRRCSCTPLPVTGQAAKEEINQGQENNPELVSRRISHKRHMQSSWDERSHCAGGIKGNDDALVGHFLFRYVGAGPSPQNLKRHWVCANPVIYTSWRGVGASGYSPTDKNKPPMQLVCMVSSLWQAALPERHLRFYRSLTPNKSPRHKYFLLHHREPKPTSPHHIKAHKKRGLHIRLNPSLWVHQLKSYLLMPSHTETRRPREWGELKDIISPSIQTVIQIWQLLSLSSSLMPMLANQHDGLISQR